MPIEVFKNNPSKLGIWLSLITVFSLWLLAKPYNGLVHDSILYSAQAMTRLLPGILDNDPFFRFGSQDNYTIFSSFHAFFLQEFGVENAALILTVLGKCLWFLGINWLGGAITTNRNTIFAVATALTLPTHYDGFEIFSYGESFATARLFAEAVGMFALGTWLRGIRLSAIGLTGLALLIHPLTALAIATTIFYCWARMPPFWGWRVLALGFASIGAFVYLGIPPFSSLMISFDGQWLSLLEKRAPYLFVDLWHESAEGRLLHLLVIAAFSRAVLPSRLKRLAESQLVVLPALIALSILGTEILHNVLLTQLQLWRAFWIAQLISIFLLWRMALSSWGTTPPGRFVIILLACATLAAGPSSGAIAASAVPGYFLAQRYFARKQLANISRLAFRRIFYIWGGGTMILMLVSNIVRIQWDWTLNINTGHPGWYALLTSPLVALTCVTLVHTGAESARWQIRAGSIFSTASAAVVAALLWQSNWNSKAIAERRGDEITLHSLQQTIPTNTTVYWPGNLVDTWFWLQRPYYASQTQGAGWVFSRSSAIETSRRQVLLWNMGFSDGIADFEPRQLPQSKKSDEATVDQLCKDPALDYLILPSNGFHAVKMVFHSLSGQGYEVIACEQRRTYEKNPPLSNRLTAESN